MAGAPRKWPLSRRPSRTGQRGCDDGLVTSNAQPPTRRARLRAAAQALGIPLPAILTTVGVVVAVFLLGKVVYRLNQTATHEITPYPIHDIARKVGVFGRGEPLGEILTRVAWDIAR